MKKVKRLAVGAFICGASSLLQANATGNPHFYLGLTQGIDQLTHTSPMVGSNALEMKNHHMGLLVGCKWIEDPSFGWVLGSEVLVRLNAHHANKSNLHQGNILGAFVHHLDLEHGQSVNVAARVGYKTPLDGLMSPIPFLKVGFITHPMRGNVNATGLGMKQIQKQFNGLTLGVGVDFPLSYGLPTTDHFMLGLEYTHVFYKKTDIPVFQGSLKANSFHVRLIYEF